MSVIAVGRSCTLRLVSDPLRFVVLPEAAPKRPAKLARVVANNRQQVNDNHRRKMGQDIRVADPDTAPDAIENPAFARSDDLAAVTVRKTRQLLAAGKLTPTLRDGLTAQQLLDRRAEKAADRQFMLNLALAMAGGGRETPEKYLPPVDVTPTVLEGEASEVDLAPEHLRKE
jgi:hypothetical protein